MEQLRIFAVRVFVRDWTAACDFYEQVLELPVQFRADEMGWAEFSAGEACLGVELVQPGDEEGEALVGRFVGVSLRAENIGQTYEDLLAKGVKFISPPTAQPWGGVLAEFKDPDGNILTLLGPRPKRR